MSDKQSSTWSGAMLRTVEKAVATLPSERELEESLEAIDSLIRFLQHLRSVLSQQPSEESRRDVLRAIEVLSGFLTSYNAKTLMSGKNKIAKSVLRSDAEVEKLFKELNELSLDEIQRRLLDKSAYSVKDLKSLAKYLCIGIDKGFRRDDIADSVFKRGFANPRGYDAIGGAAARRIQSESRGRVSSSSGDDS